MSYRPITVTQDILELNPVQTEEIISRPLRSPNGSSTKGERVLEMAVDKVLQAPDGTKHDTLVKMCYLLGGYVAQGLITEPEAEGAMRDAISRRANVDNLKAAFKTIAESIEDGKSNPVEEQAWSSSSGGYIPKTSTPEQPAVERTPPHVLDEQLAAASIDFSEDLVAPPVCLEIEQGGVSSIIGTLGNFSMVIGKAKSKKTFFITIALAAAISNGNVLGLFKGTLPPDKNMVLFFDTEQAKYHVQKAARRVLHLAGNQGTSNFRAYGLRKYSPQERLAIIEHALYHTPKVGFVVIDGVRDLITSINDEEQATMIATKLLKWTEELDIHILCVLHQNKGDANARGHVGSELQNKAETVLSVTKDTKHKEISIVAAEYCREREFEPFGFDIDNFGVPQLVDSWHTSSSEDTPKKPSYLPGSVAYSTHCEILSMAFEGEEKLLRSQLLEKVKYALSKQEIFIGDNKVKDYITHYVGEKMITQEGTPGTKKSFYRLSLQPG